jgi:hypothetical protein
MVTVPRETASPFLAALGVVENAAWSAAGLAWGSGTRAAGGPTVAPAGVWAVAPHASSKAVDKATPDLTSNPFMDAAPLIKMPAQC